MPEKLDSAALRADAEALEWLVALQDAPDDADVRARFEQWRAAGPLNAAAWEDTAQVYADIGQTQPAHAERWERLAKQRQPVLSAPILAIGANRRRRPAASGRRRPVRQAAKVAIPAVAAAMLAVVAGPDLAVRWQADAIAGIGEVRDVKLADGSRASLSPGSAFRIDYSDKERRITLLRGQAWFDVRHESDRPFRVVTGDVATTDIGTAFEVGSLASGIHVTVEQGIVRVDDLGHGRSIAERLVAGQSLAIDKTGQVRQAIAPPYLVSAWRDGQIAVQNRPVGEVVDALRPWYRGIIVLRSDVLSRQRVTGVYDLRNPARALDALTKAHGGSVTQITPWILVLSDS
ncbi:MAG: FecR domain-containing protein [Sphingobium sp.]